MSETTRSKARRQQQKFAARRKTFPLPIDYGRMGLSDIERMSSAEYAAQVAKDNQVVKGADLTARYSTGLREVEE